MTLLRQAAEFVRRVYRWMQVRKQTPRTMASHLRKLGAEVGEDCYIVPSTIADQIDPKHLKIGNHVAIAIDVCFAGDDGSEWFGNGNSGGAQASRRVEVGDNCFIGTRAIIYPNVCIGPNAIVAAGSVVTSDVPPNSVVAGVPARPFGSLERYREKCAERWAEQRPADVVIEPGATWWTSVHLMENRERLRRRLLQLFGARLAALPEKESGAIRAKGV